MRMTSPAVDDTESEPKQGPTGTLHRVRSALTKRGFLVVADDDENPTQLAASRGLSGKFAPLVVHLSLLLILLGGAAGLALGSSSEVMIGDGEKVVLGTVLDRGRRQQGPLYEYLNPSKSRMDSTAVNVDDFRIKYRESGEVEQFYSILTVLDQETGEKVFTDEIYVNKPLSYGGSTVYQADWGLDRLQLYVNGRALIVPLKSLPPQAPGDRSWGAFLPAQVLETIDPNRPKSTSNDDGIVFVAENMRNVQVYGADRTLAGILRSPLQPLDPRISGMPIPIAESIKVDGLELRLDRILGATGLIVKSWVHQSYVVAVAKLKMIRAY